MIIFVSKELMTKGDALLNKINRERFRRTDTFKTTEPNRYALSPNAKREKQDSKFFFTEHVVKGDMDIVIRMFNRIIRNNEGDKRSIEGISKRRERGKETSKATFNGFKVNEREAIF